MLFSLWEGSRSLPRQGTKSTKRYTVCCFLYGRDCSLSLSRELLTNEIVILINTMEKSKKKLRAAKELCNEAKIGTEIKCPSCNSPFTKKAYNSVFCKTKGKSRCKDNYWNNVDQSKRCNTTRISPANKAYYNVVILPKEAADRGYPDVEEMLNDVPDDDGTWEAHQCHVEPCEWCKLLPKYCRCD